MAIIREEFYSNLTHIDIGSKIYDEEFTKKIYFLGILIFKRHYSRREAIKSKDPIGFK